MHNFSIVGAGALDSPLEGARFELSRAHVENIMWITQMRLQTKCRRGGTSGAPSPTWLLCCRKIVGLVVFFYSIFKLRSGCDIGDYALGCVYTKYRNAHSRFDTSTLQPVPESLIVFTKSQGLYVPASIKTLSTYPENHHFCCIKNATIAEILPN